MTNLKDKLTKLAGIPRLELTPLKKTAVHIQTQEECDELMRVYEMGSWRGRSGRLPTEFNYFKKCSKETCVTAGTDYTFEQKGKFGYGNKDFYLGKNWDVISRQEFYNIQKITSEMIKEINKHFEERK